MIDCHKQYPCSIHKNIPMHNTVNTNLTLFGGYFRSLAKTISLNFFAGQLQQSCDLCKQKNSVLNIKKHFAISLLLNCLRLTLNHSNFIMYYYTNNEKIHDFLFVHEKYFIQNIFFEMRKN